MNAEIKTILVICTTLVITECTLFCCKQYSCLHWSKRAAVTYPKRNKKSDNFIVIWESNIIYRTLE